MTAPKRVTFPSGGQSITVEVFDSARGKSRSPAIIMLHGADGLGGHTQYRSGAKAIAEAGYQVFLVHYLDRTGERRASFATVFQNFLPWMATVSDAVDWVEARPDVDGSRIGIVGISLGAALGLAVASQDRRIRALVDYFGPLPQGVIAPGAVLPPTLILHGGADPVVPVANAYAIENLLNAGRSSYAIKIYPGEGHGFYGATQRDASERVVAFLEDALGRNSGEGTAPLSAAG